MKKFLTTNLLALSLVVTGCATNVPLDEPQTTNPTTSQTAATDTNTSSTSNTTDANKGVDAGSNNTSMVEKVEIATDDGAAKPIVGRTIYFDLDSYTVKSEFVPVLETQAKRLNADRRARVLIEGHTDERGGSEYNLALGQRRAEAVARALKIMGVQDAQVEAVSFGKERPAAEGHDEDSWAKNRRAELKDR